MHESKHTSTAVSPQLRCAVLTVVNGTLTCPRNGPPPCRSALGYACCAPLQSTTADSPVRSCGGRSAASCGCCQLTHSLAVSNTRSPGRFHVRHAAGNSFTAMSAAVQSVDVQGAQEMMSKGYATNVSCARLSSSFLTRFRTAGRCTLTCARLRSTLPAMRRGPSARRR